MSNLSKEHQQALKYKKLTQHQHILQRPDTYVGDISSVEEDVWVHNRETGKIELQKVRYCPAFLKIVDEILVNAADNKQRDAESTTNISLFIDPFSGRISITNNGMSIPLIVHPEYQIHVPEVIFGHLLTGTNFDDEEERTTGGRNGYGAKLANVYSTTFDVDIVYCDRRYTQKFENNMFTIHPPVIQAFEGPPTSEDPSKLRGAKKEAYLHRNDQVTVSFVADFVRFNMPIPSVSQPMSAGLVALLRRRLIDIAGTMTRYSIGKMKVVPTLKVTCVEGCSPDGKECVTDEFQFRSFKDYLLLYSDLTGPAGEKLLFSERINDHWEVAVALGNGDAFQQVSFVNCIHTMTGGTHVNHVLEQVIEYIQETVLVKKKIAKMKNASIKPFLTLFVNAVIVNPTFGQQTKTELTNKVKDFKPDKCTLAGHKCLEKLLQSNELVDLLTSKSNKTQDIEFSKAMSGSKKDCLADIDKLEDATFAGTSKGHLCTLVITEGDSAYALFTSAKKVIGNKLFGGIPMKGKTVNVRGAKYDKVMKNIELHNLVRILGLKFGKEYKTEADIRTLRYGHFMAMTDQDVDGSHIKGLLINFFDVYWPSLLRYPGFWLDFQTPLKKCLTTDRSLPPEISFFNENDYRKWMESVGPEIAGRYTVKYYKGLGTSTAKEACAYFKDLEKHQFFYDFEEEEEANGRPTTYDLIDLAFNSSRADDRKTWLLTHDASSEVQVKIVETIIEGKKVLQKHISLSDFINVNLKDFSNSDLHRSIGSLFDGLKPSQRKILYSCFKRNLKSEVKVAQLAGYVSEHAAYHNGESSLCSAIIGMAQNFIGSNNIQLLRPAGQFGTRNKGGKDAAASRYIFTCLEKITRCLFHVDDDTLLDYLEDDGQKIEPKYYLPIIPTVLVNGMDGIGTGWSTFIPKFNPRDVIAKVYEFVYALKEGRKTCVDPSETIVSSATLKPWYRGFHGTISPYDAANKRYETLGRIERIDGDCTKFRIFELPINSWTEDYKSQLKEWDMRINANGSSSNNASSSAPSIWNNQDDNRSITSLTKKKKMGKVNFPFIKDVKNGNTDVSVEFIIECDEDALYGSGTLSPDASEYELATFFKLRTYLSMNNMHLFNEHGVIEKFHSAEAIVHRFCVHRLDLYAKRKDYLLSKLSKEVLIATNKARFITMVADGELDLRRRKGRELDAEMTKLGFYKDESIVVAAEKEKEEEEGSSSYLSPFEYLLKMPLKSITSERVPFWIAQKEKKEMELRELQNKPIEDLWIEDLNRLELALTEFEKESDENYQSMKEMFANQEESAGNNGKRKRKAANEAAAASKGKKVKK